jgi:HAD superfamily hydrolase (TIGR01662 family)
MTRQAVFLDVGWTLIYPEHSFWEILSDLARSAGAQVSAADCEASIHPMWQAAQSRAVSAFHPDAEYTDSDEEFASVFRHLGHAVLAAAGMPDASGELIDRFVEVIGDWDLWRVYPEVPDALERLQRDGYVVAAVSNASSDLPAFLEHLGLAQFFDIILASAAEGTKKPDRRLFQRALERTDASPAQALHVGDFALEDVLGARNAGVAAALMHRGPLSLFPSFAPDLPAEAAGTPIVTDLVEARALLP